MTSLSDELLSINSIYGDRTLELESTAPPDSASSVSVCILRLPSAPSIALRLEFPANYPEAPLCILGTQSVGEDVAKGDGIKVVDLVRDVLARVYEPGNPCVFDLIEEVGEVVARAETDHGPQRYNEDQWHDSIDHSGDEPDSVHTAAERHPGKSSSLDQEPPWVVSEPITVKKSVFHAHIAPISSVTVARTYLAHLLSVDKKVAKATHNITAWRVRGANGTTFQDCDDDGETAAGGRLLHLLQVMDVWDVMVIVSRWYGGIQLGPDRFRLINMSARDGLMKAGFVKEKLNAVDSEKKKKR